MARTTTVQYPWGVVAPRERLTSGRRSLRKALTEVGVGGFRDVPKRVRKVLDVAEKLVSTLEYVARSGLPRSAQSHRVPASEIVEHVARVNASVRVLAGASALTLSPRYLELAKRLEALLALAERVHEFGVDADGSLIPSNAWKAFGPPP